MDDETPDVPPGFENVIEKMKAMMLSVEEASGVVMVQVPKEIAEEWERLGMIERDETYGYLRYQPGDSDDVAG